MQTQFGGSYARLGRIGETRIDNRVRSEVSSAKPSINTDVCDTFVLTRLAEAVTSFSDNLVGNPGRGDSLIIEIVSTSTHALAWGAKFEAGVVALPTACAGGYNVIAFIWRVDTAKWRCVGVV